MASPNTKQDPKNLSDSPKHETHKGLFSDHPLINKGEPPASLQHNNQAHSYSESSVNRTNPNSAVVSSIATKTTNSIADFLHKQLIATPSTNSVANTDAYANAHKDAAVDTSTRSIAHTPSNTNDDPNMNTSSSTDNDLSHDTKAVTNALNHDDHSHEHKRNHSSSDHTHHPQDQVSHKAKQIKTTVAQGEPLKLAIVGHTNTGKTSILRTLLRDMYFGEVKNEAATTRHVERAIINDSMSGEALVALYDTPGLEDASGLMDWLEDNTASRRDGIERLQQFLANPIAGSSDNHPTHHTPTNTANTQTNDVEDYTQEAKVIRQLLASDMAIYVIDAREPVLGKYKDELIILSWAAIPIMPVFNFSATEHGNISDWQTMLARRNLHISTRFDSVAFEFEDEMTLWQNLATMLTHSEMIDTLIARRRDDWQQLYEQATLIIADFLINIAAYVREVDHDEDSLLILKEMQEAIRQTERTMQSKLLNLYKFYDNTAVATPLNLSEYQQDPFDPELLKSYGLRTTSGAAAGALLGLGIDAAALGTTLGLGAALGGIAGGLLSNTSSIADKITGVKRLFIDPATLTLLATRSLDLLASLRHRGHAAKPDSMITELQAVTNSPWSPTKLPSELKKAHGKPHWSSLNGTDSEQAASLRYDAAFSLSAKLERTNQVERSNQVKRST